MMMTKLRTFMKSLVVKTTVENKICQCGTQANQAVVDIL